MSTNPSAFAPSAARSANFTVAASNASAKWKGAADFVCTGSNDDVKINAAMAALLPQGGTVVLSDGLFTISSALIPTVNRTKLRGQGPDSTVIQAAVGANCNGYQFDVSQAISLIFCSIEGVTFNGNFNSGSGNTSGFGCHINYNLTFTFWDFYLRDVWFENWAQDGWFSTGGHGYVLDHVLGEFCGGNGLNLAGGAFTDSPARIVHGTFKLNTLAGITIGATSGQSVVDALVLGNEISSNNGPFGLILSASGLKAIGNQITNNKGSGAHITGGHEGVEFIGNTVSTNATHGLLLDNANCTIDGNFFTGNSFAGSGGTTGAADEINVAAGTFSAAGNFITGNVIDCAASSRYGINLAAGTDTACVLTANRIVSPVTAPTNTVPTDTIVLASGNFTIGPAFLRAPSVYAPGTQTTQSVSTTTMAAFSSANINTGTFVAPVSGIVIVSLRCSASSAAATFAGFGLAAHGTVTPLVCNSVVLQFADADVKPLAIDFYVSGLTPGASFNFDLVGCASVGSVTITAFAESGTSPVLSAAGVGSPVVMTVLGQ